MSRTEGSRRRRPWRLVLLSFAAVFGAVVLWYAAARIFWSVNQVAVRHIDGVSAAAGDEPLTAACWNMAHGRGGKLGASNWSHSDAASVRSVLDCIAAAIVEEDADLVVLNEVDFSCAWSYGINQAEYIAREAGYSYRLEQVNYAVSIPFFTLRFGNALLSRFPIENAEPIRFHPFSRAEAIFAGNHDGFVCDVALPDGRTVSVAGIHMEVRDEAVRRRGMDVLAALASSRPSPLVVMGDFNSTPPPLPDAQLDSDGRNAMEVLFREHEFIPFVPLPEAGRLLSFPSASPRRLIDWIAGAGSIAFVNPRIHPATCSDHLMVAAEVDVE